MRADSTTYILRSDTSPHPSGLWRRELRRDGGVARGNQSLAQTLDAWIIEEKAKGTVDALYRYWMLGDAAKSAKPPRWSVIRNVLHWVP